MERSWSMSGSPWCLPNEVPRSATPASGAGQIRKSWKSFPQAPLLQSVEDHKRDQAKDADAAEDAEWPGSCGYADGSSCVRVAHACGGVLTSW